MKNNKLSRDCADYEHLFGAYIKRGANSLTNVELRALSEASGGGGTVLVPTVYAKKFDEILGDDIVYRSVSKMIVNSATISVPVVTSARVPMGGLTVQKNPGEAGTLIDATTTATQVVAPTIALPGTSNTGTDTATLALKRISVMVKVTNELLQDTEGQGDASVESWIIRQASQDISKEINRQILLGNATDSVTAGTGSVLGSDSCHGLANTLKRYSTRSTTTTLAGMGGSVGNMTNTTNGHLAATLGICDMDKLQMSYWNRATWIFNNRAHYYAPGVNAVYLGTGYGTATLMGSAFQAFEQKVFGRPWTMAEMSPGNSGTTTGLSTGDFIVIACDLSRYTFFSTSEGVQITRLNETFADNNQTAFIVSMRCAGVLTDINAAYGVYRG